jgi:hypothetical protein
MIFDTTYFSKEIKKQIDSALGKPFSPFSVIKIGVIGSSRMMIKSSSPGFDSLVKANLDLTYANIGLRPNGIIVILSKSYKNLSWVIPYHHLSIYKTDVLSIHAAGEFLKLKINDNQNMKFINKVLDRKIKYLTP